MLPNISTTALKKGLMATLLLLGSAATIKSLQDIRYVKKDMKSVSDTSLTQTDLEVYRRRYKLTEKEMEDILAADKAKKQAATENKIENDPNFVHKRVVVAGRDY